MARRKSGRGGMRAGAGRPPKPEEERQTHRVMVRFTAAEHESLERAAGGRSLATWIRELVLRALSRRRNTKGTP